MRVMVNPDDQLSWHRALQHYDGVGPKLSQQMVDSIVAQKSAGVGMDLSQFSKKGAYDDLLSLRQLVFGGREKQSPAEVLQRVVDFYTPILKMYMMIIISVSKICSHWLLLVNDFGR